MEVTYADIHFPGETGASKGRRERPRSGGTPRCYNLTILSLVTVSLILIGVLAYLLSQSADVPSSTEATNFLSSTCSFAALNMSDTEKGLKQSCLGVVCVNGNWIITKVTTDLLDEIPDPCNQTEYPSAEK